jgi:NAD(P)H-hydrate epimerase
MFLERLSKISRRRSRRIRENFFLTIFLSSTFAKSAAYSPSLPMAMTTISAQSAAALDAELMSGDAPPFKLEQLMELAGLAVAQATQKSSCVQTPMRILIVSGPGNNGGDGLVAGRHLLSFGHQVTVFSLKKRTNSSFLESLEQQIELFGGRVVRDSWPELWTPEFLTNSFDLCIDSIFGFSFKGEIRSPWNDIIHILSRANSAEHNLAADGTQLIAKRNLKIISVDIPSGWSIDGLNTGILFPDVLISLTAPKEVALRLEQELLNKKKNYQHWLGGRFVPPSVMEKYGLRHLLSFYKGDDQVIQLR